MKITDKLKCTLKRSVSSGAVQQFGFLLGVLCGMKNMGASKEELLRRSQGFVISEIEYARYCADPDPGSDRKTRRKLKAVRDGSEVNHGN